MTFGFKAILAWFVVFFLAGCGNTANPTFLSTDITNASFGRELKLPGPTGEIRTLADFKGKVVALFFGYTQCPDICPATMSKLTGALQKLGADAARVQVLFVTLDPERDTPSVLQKYLSAFNPAFIGLSGDAKATREVANEFKIVYQKAAGNTPDHEIMEHSAGTYLFDPQGRLRLYVSSEKGEDVFVHDIAGLLKAAG
ncbi:MAG TPA: SCO family protein [Nitrosospira sp.]|nr:SCO family protein [Nitrosospira sp.]